MKKEQRQSIAAAENVAGAIAKRKELSDKGTKKGVDLVALTETLAERAIKNKQ